MKHSITINDKPLKILAKLSPKIPFSSIACCVSHQEDEILLIKKTSAASLCIEFYLIKLFHNDPTTDSAADQNNSSIQQMTISDPTLITLPSEILKSKSSTTSLNVQMNMEVCALRNDLNSNEKCIICGYNGKLFKMELESGKIKWIKDMELSVIQIDRRGIIYIGSYMGNITLVDSLNGNQLFKKSISLDLPIYSLNFDLDDNLLIGSMKKRSYAPCFKSVDNQWKKMKEVKQLDFYSKSEFRIECDYSNTVMYTISHDQRSIDVYSKAFSKSRNMKGISSHVGTISYISLINQKFLLIIGSIGLCLLETNNIDP